MTEVQKYYLSMLVKDRWNKLVYESEMGIENSKIDEEYNMIQSLFDDGILDEKAVY